MSNERSGKPLELSPDDRRVMDQLLEDGLADDAIERLAGEDQPRAQRIVGLLDLLHDYPVEDADDTLVATTLLNIKRHDEQRADRMRLDPVQDVHSGRQRRLRVPDLISVAAVLLIGASIIFPIMHSLRQEHQIQRSQNNLRYVSDAVDNYAGDFGQIPTARAGLDSLVRTAFTDAINLTPLVRLQYCELNDPESPKSTPVQTRRLDASHLVLFLGDRNPVMDALREGRLDDPLKVELDHREQGRNLLTDNSAILWLRQSPAMQEQGLWQSQAVLWLADDIRPAPSRD